MTSSSTKRTLLILTACAIALRIVAGLWRGETGLMSDGYGFYAGLSQNLLDGIGLCYSSDGGCAARVPLYPLWLVPFVATGTLFPGAIIGQAIVGASLVWIAWALGSRLFDERVGLVAAAAAAVSPYAVIHDTALQDTVFVNVLLPLSIVLLLQARASGSSWHWFGGGLALALAVLSNARVALFIPAALAWTLFAAGETWRRRLGLTLLVGLPVLLLVGGWMVRNWRVVGAPVLTTEAGDALWYGNNPWTFAHFPERSIDLTEENMRGIDPNARELLNAFPGTEAERDTVVAGWAIDYMLADPSRTVTAVARKLWVPAAAQFSPARGPAIQAGYALVFLPIHAAALFSLWRARRQWRTHGLAWLLLLTFGLTTAAFWAHTSHKSYLDAVLFVYAAAALMPWLPARTAGAPA